MFTEKRFIYRESIERGSPEHIELRDERFENRQNRQSNRNENRDERQERRHENRNERLEKKYENRSENHNPELSNLRTEVETSQVEQERQREATETLDATREQLPTIGTPSEQPQEDTLSTEPSTNLAEKEPHTQTLPPAQNSATSERQRISFEYEDAVDRSLGGFTGGLMELLGVDTSEIATKLAIDGADINDIGTMKSLLVGFGLFFNKLFGNGKTLEISDIPLDANDTAIVRREMEKEEWDNLTDDESEADSVHVFTNLFANDRLEINENHELFIPEGTRIRDISNELVAVTETNPATNVEIPKDQTEWVADQNLILRRTYLNENEREKENKLNSGILFIGTVTYRPNSKVEEPEEEPITNQ